MSRLSLVALAAALAAVATAGPPVQAKAAVVMDLDSGRVLFELNSAEPRYPASTTKVMTALLLVEAAEPQTVFVAPADVKEIEGASLYLSPGERVSARDLLYALLLRSANDACHTIALQLAGSEEAFAERMNARAAELGCQGTVFRTPHGLPDPGHKTSALDLALITREAMRHPDFAEAARTQRKVIDRSLNLQNRLLLTRNKWLQDPRATGVKTGYTKDAGHCFVGSAESDGRRIVTVVLASPDWLAETKTLTDWAFATHRRRLLVGPQSPGVRLPVLDGSRGEVKVRAKAELWALVGDAESPYRISWPEGAVKAPILAGQDVGRGTIEFADGGTLTFDIVADEEVGKRPPFLSAVGSPFGMLTAILMVGGYAMLRRKSRRMARRRR
jgi:serine-type D-Ala-D-Ala carboxypeptidase (penicillin-binding protein 5/6)